MDENNFIENNTIRYQFIIVLFFLSFVVFNEKTFQFMKKQTSFTKNKLFIFHCLLFVSIVYFMLKVSGSSFLLSPCNIDVDLDEYLKVIESDELNN